VQPRIGALLRQEALTRFYLREFTNTGHVRGLRKYGVLLCGNRILEDQIESESPPRQTWLRPIVLIFQGLRQYFDDIRNDRELIDRELRRIVNPRVLRKLPDFARERFVAIHVRRGDITKSGLSTETLLSQARYTPDNWFLSAIDAIRTNRHWRKFPMLVFSDGTSEEITDFLQAGCHKLTTGSAIGDLLLMSKAQLLVASGHSTFSMWASYLGAMPTIYCPGKMQQRIFPIGCEAFEGEWSPREQLPPALEQSE
jgi:hypothetical protein